jgi:hypothetical protein
MAVATKCVLEQAVFAPFAIGGYISVRGAFEGKSPTQIAEKLQLRWADAWLSALQFWPVANAVSFAFVPVMYRALYGSLCAVFWNARLSALSADQPSTAAAALVADLSEQHVIGQSVVHPSARQRRYKLSPEICLSNRAVQTALRKRNPQRRGVSESMHLSRGDSPESVTQCATAPIVRDVGVESRVQGGCATMDLYYDNGIDIPGDNCLESFTQCAAAPIVRDIGVESRVQGGCATMELYYDDGIDVPDDGWDGWVEAVSSCAEVPCQVDVATSRGLPTLLGRVSFSFDRLANKCLAVCSSQRQITCQNF